MSKNQITSQPHPFRMSYKERQHNNLIVSEKNSFKFYKILNWERKMDRTIGNKETKSV